jgi:acetylornithine/N-succinyldiaminopimelate aminotransferase
MLALMTPADEIATEIILKAQEKGLILFWLLFEKKGGSHYSSPHYFK